MWENLTEWLSQFFDKEVVVIIVSITYALAAILIIISKTSFGKKAIADLTALFNKGVKIAKESNEKVIDVEKLAKEKIEALKADYEQKTTALVSIVNFYEESLFQIIEKIPNKKVQDELLVLKESYGEKKKEINQWVTLTYQDAQEEIQTLVKKVEEEKDIKIARLTGEIEELKELVNSFINSKEEGQNGEKTEESKDSQTTQEEI